MWRGGDGVEREIEFLRPLTASILSERRSLAPFGLLGGRPGARGVNLWQRSEGTTVSLGGKATIQAQGGDRIRILTPGGGGYGPPEDEADPAAVSELRQRAADIARARAEALGRAVGDIPRPRVAGGSLAKFRADQHSA